MPKFAANLTMLYNEVDFLDRFAAAAKDGFAGVEFLFPYAYAKDELAGRLREHGLTQALHNLPAGDWAGGERGIACLPERLGEFRDGVAEAACYAEALGCPRLNCIAGRRGPGLDEALLRATLVDNLRHAADVFAPAGRQVLLEPLNSRDTPDFLIDRSASALALLEEAGRPNLGLQYDIYHAQVMEGDLTNTLARNLRRIGHIQLADNPGRHQPGTGEIHFPFLFQHLHTLGYDGWIGCEYVPLGATEDSFDWML